MKTFIMKPGLFLNKETGETSNTINGHLKAIKTETTEEGNRFLLFIFGDPEAEDTLALKVKLYGDASLKILRCLYGIFDEIGGKEVAITLTPQEGAPAQIGLTADGETLDKMCYVGEYTIDRKNLTDMIVKRLSHSLSRVNVPLLVVHVDEQIDLTDEDRPESTVIAEFIRSARVENRVNRYTIAKHSFTDGVMQDGYIIALREVAVLGRTFLFKSQEDIDRVWLAHVEPLEAPAAGESAEGTTAEANGDEEI
jgi:hypothetical protein